ncbi:universal stress protein [Streptoalloteichus hindustanus]|uniref:BON domain-containing protein n=1 Tax=Streptoalloteichus hindustanus TaxID=2017 RepID=A0A1M5DSC6_STRHI|nr:universal stress protein [Streptoalloteichus hindustanus]SHF69835.1 BON domain-containing protein [Streptoalloteichus hindustanus]
MPVPTVASVMTRDVVTISEDTRFKDIVALLTDRGISAVPVTDSDGQLVGVVSEADLLAKEEYRAGLDRAPTLLPTPDPEEGSRRAEGLTAGDVMTRGAACVRPDDPVVAVARRLAQANVRRMFVLDETGQLVGVVARRDLLRLYLRPDERVRDDVCELLGEVVGGDATGIEVRVDHGVVTLRGSMPTHAQGERVTRAVRALPGVVGVEDGLTRSDAEAPVSPAGGGAALSEERQAGGRGRDAEHPTPPVVVGVSGIEEEDAPVVAWAAEEAARRGAALRLVHVYVALPYTTPVMLNGPIPPLDDEAVREAGRAALDRAANQVRATHPALDLGTELTGGQPELALRTESATASLLVLGAHHHGPLAEAVLGSTAGAMSVTSACPVVAVPVDRQPSAPDGPVVVGVDDPGTARAAVEFAVAEASRRGVDLHAVHCWAGQAALGGEVPDEPERHEQVLAEATAELAERWPDVRLHTTSVRGDALSELLRRSDDAALLVVGTHGRHRLGAVVLGSVSRALLRSARCPVAVVRPRG